MGLSTYDCFFTEKQLKAAYDRSEIAGMAVNNSRITFVFQGGLKNGVVTTTAGSIKNYRNDEAAWTAIEKIKGLHLG